MKTSPWFRRPIVQLLLIGAALAGGLGQVAAEPDLRIERGYCSACEEWSVDLDWQGDWALYQSTDLSGWRLSNLPVEVMLDGSRNAQLQFRLEPGSSLRQFFRLRQDDPTWPHSLTSVGDREYPEVFSPPPFTEAPDELPLQLARAEPVYQIRVRAVQTSNSDGSQDLGLGEGHVEDLIQQANAVYWTAGIEFVFDPATDFETRRDDRLNHDFEVLIDLENWTDQNDKPSDRPWDDLVNWAWSNSRRTSVADERPDAITVFFRHGDKFIWGEDEEHWILAPAGGGYSSWASGFVAMPAGTGEKNLLAHELGHYLHEPHPFHFDIADTADAANAIIVELIRGLPESDGLQALDGDRHWVLDTPADVKFDIYTPQNLDPGDPHTAPAIIPAISSTGHIGRTYTLDPVHRNNIMSYYKHHYFLAHSLSPQQIERLRDGLINGNRQRLLGTVGKNAILELREEGQAAGGTIAADFDIVRTRHGQLATAVRGDDDKILLKAWHVDSRGNIEPKGSNASAGKATKLTAVNLGLGLVATAFKSETGTLKVIIWQVDPEGNWVRRGDGDYSPFGIGAGTTIDSIATARMGVHHFVTAVRSARGNVSLVVWRSYADGRVALVTSRAIGNYRDVSLSPAGWGNEIFTALTTTGGNLRAAVWRLRSNQSLVKASSLDVGAVGDTKSAVLDINLNATVVRIPSTSELQVITWGFSRGGALTLLDNHVHDDVNTRDDAFAATRLGVDLLGVARVSPRNLLEIGVWWTKNEGDTIIDADNVTSIPALQVQTEQVGFGKLAVAARTPTGQLDLRIWRVLKIYPIP